LFLKYFGIKDDEGVAFFGRIQLRLEDSLRSSILASPIGCGSIEKGAAAHWPRRIKFLKVVKMELTMNDV